MPIFSMTNQYLGINAHLHSHFLHHEAQGWEEFHSSHITDLTRAMNAHLPGMGYIARQERSLQIRHFDDHVSAPVSDVLISDLERTRDRAASVGVHQSAQQALQVPASVLLEPDPDEVKRPTAIKIYELVDSGQREKPVAWIELLSPSNKVGSGLSSYVAKREALLANWLVFVEMDYLHGVSTTLDTVPNYRASGGEPHPPEDAHPYHLWMIDPRLPPDSPESGAIASFAVDQPIPSLNIPLNHGDTLTFDFNAVYQQTFRAQPAFGLVVDYAIAPESVEEDYNRRDQTTIAARMLTVQQSARDGHNLDQESQPVEAELLERLQNDYQQVLEVLRSGVEEA